MRPRQLDAILLIALTALTLAAFWPSLSCGFVNFDDGLYVTHNRHVLGGLTWPSIAWAFTTHHADNYHPLTWLSLMTDAQLWGGQARGFHLSNVVLHAANVGLLFLAFAVMTGSRWRSALAAALFAVHPLRAESVAWVTERKDVLSTFFGLLAILAYVAYARRPQARRYVLVVVLFALSLLAKPMLVTLPVLLLLLDLWPLKRWRFSASTSEPPTSTNAFPPRSPRKLVLEKLPLLGLSLISGIVTFWISSLNVTLMPLEQWGLGPRLANAAVACVQYLGHLFWFPRLAMFYPLVAPSSAACEAGAVLILTIISALSICLRRRAPWLAVGWSWFLIALLPVIGLVQVGQQAMADRYTYVPMMGLGLMLAWSIPSRFVQRTPGIPGKAVIGAASLAVLVTLGYFTRLQVATWHDSRSLAEHTLSVTKENWLAHKNLGAVLVSEGRPDEAIPEYEESLRIRPETFDAHFDLAQLLADRGRVEDAKLHYQAAIKLRPDLGELHVQFANFLAMHQAVDEAIQEYEAGLKIDATLAEGHNNLASLRGARGDHAAELRGYEAAVAADPDYPMGQRNLGLILIRQGRVAEAIPHLEAVVRLEPGSAVDRERLATALAMLRAGLK